MLYLKSQNVFTITSLNIPFIFQTAKVYKNKCDYYIAKITVLSILIVYITLKVRKLLNFK